MSEQLESGFEVSERQPPMRYHGRRKELVLTEHDCAYCRAFVERWRPEMHTFHMSFGECTVTLQDVAFQLGLPVDGEAKFINGGRPAWEWFQDLFGELPPPNKVKQMTIHFTWFHERFRVLPVDATKETIYLWMNQFGKLEQHYLVAVGYFVIVPSAVRRNNRIRTEKYWRRVKVKKEEASSTTTKEEASSTTTNEEASSATTKEEVSTATKQDAVVVAVVNAVAAVAAGCGGNEGGLLDWWWWLCDCDEGRASCCG
ncbi:hypothetical protein Ahy_A04g021221 [Arachis hypogaea]|uniref:Aminotransferase-like plant mobile domain-containing protein n=1 Tax=Arachis hypogaea TaxID=3818 RepID=A0A445DJU0_ARAHY|nr:hypothetical protein Ahy_A04g021221 [Arachis hypogaea]